MLKRFNTAVESANGAGTQRRDVFNRSLEGFDEALDVGPESLMGQPNGIAFGQRPDRFRQLIRMRHARLVHQHRDNPLAKLERGLDFDAHEVIGIVEASAAVLIGGVEPVVADHRQHRVALRHLRFQHADEVFTGRDIVDVYEKPLGRERLLQTTEERLRESRLIAAAIINENFAAHALKHP